MPRRHLDIIERRHLREALRRTSCKVAMAKPRGLAFQSFRYGLAKSGVE